MLPNRGRNCSLRVSFFRSSRVTILTPWKTSWAVCAFALLTSSATPMIDLCRPNASRMMSRDTPRRFAKSMSRSVMAFETHFWPPSRTATRCARFTP